MSKGILNKDGAFSEEIFRVYLKSDHPEEDIETITAFIDAAARTASSEDAVKQKILNLNSLLADEAIAAEKTRNEILYQVEDIQKQKKDLVQYRLKKRNTIAAIAVLAVLINLVMLYFMAYFVVERPLKHLTQVIGKINKGETVFIPFQKQKDQIGILAGAVKDFQSALTCLQKEDQRKKMERTMIQDIIRNMSELIDTLQKKAISMKDAAGELSLLASDTEDETQGATRSAAKTVEQTDTVSYSTRQLQSAVADISIQVSKQNELVADINASLKASITDIDELTNASEQINEIVHIVDTIAGDTKLLALNARIEAARSGAAGKGFAVVAGEVRELSIQTEAANGDIAVKIESIQKVSRTITENTRKIQARIENLMDASHQISAAVEEQTSVTTGIAKNAQATTRDINDVSGRISRVNKAARTTSEFAQNVQSHSEEIAGELSDLLNETREKLSLIGLSDSLNRAATLPEQPDLSKNAA